MQPFKKCCSGLRPSAQTRGAAGRVLAQLRVEGNRYDERFVRPSWPRVPGETGGCAGRWNASGASVSEGRLTHRERSAVMRKFIRAVMAMLQATIDALTFVDRGRGR